MGPYVSPMNIYTCGSEYITVTITFDSGFGVSIRVYGISAAAAEYITVDMAAVHMDICSSGAEIGVRIGYNTIFICPISDRRNLATAV
ncbi:MAG: hypothetical protein BWY95_00942 [Bacteroidetes bacterium ADurb.BinA104]|nr:MAG: hypothetical protein BWY95_00942 [Bacteroidetes bacterium ADurb.BinA104]